MGRSRYIDKLSWQWATWHVSFRPVHCRATGCPHPVKEQDCPVHGIHAYYARHAAAGTDSGD